LLVYLQNASHNSEVPDTLLSRGIPGMIRKGKEFPFIVVAPILLPTSFWWNSDTINFVLEKVLKTYRVDSERIYASGFRDGGAAVRQLAIDFPNKFAAVVPVGAVGGRPSEAWAMYDTPSWSFHGESDSGSNVELPKKIVEAVQAAGGKAQLTILPKKGWNIADTVYSDPQIYFWMISHRRVPKATNLKRAQISFALLTGISASGDSVFSKDTILLPQQRKVTILIRNDAPVSAQVRARLEPHASFSVDTTWFDAAIPSNQSYSRTISLSLKERHSLSSLAPLVVSWEVRYAPEGMDPFTFSQRGNIAFVHSYSCPRTSKPVIVDGNLDSWGKLPIMVKTPAQILKRPQKYQGPESCWWSIGSCYDSSYVYVGIHVHDDTVLAKQNVYPWHQDGIEIRIDGRDYVHRTDKRKIEEFQDVLLVAFSPVISSAKPDLFDPERKMIPGLLWAARIVKDGYNEEIGIPVSYLNAMHRREWDSFRLNVAVNNWNDSTGGPQMWWNPDWRTETYMTGSGTFFRK
jgi:predicted esterase